MDEIRAMNHMLVPKGLCMLPVRCEGGSALLYVYRPGRLQQDLQNDLAQRLLQKAGYSRGGSALCVSQLVQRLRRQEDFSSRGRAVSQLPAGGCGGLHRQQRPPVQMRRPVEGLRG